MHVIGFLLGLPSGVWVAYVISKLWLWFIVPLGPPAITWPHAWGGLMLVGLVLLPSLLTLLLHTAGDDAGTKFPPNIRPLASAVGLAVGALGALGIGAVIHHFGMPH